MIQQVESTHIRLEEGYGFFRDARNHSRACLSHSTPIYLCRMCPNRHGTGPGDNAGPRKTSEEDTSHEKESESESDEAEEDMSPSKTSFIEERKVN